MPALNLPDLSAGFVDIGALVSPPKRAVPPPVEVPDYVPDPTTFSARMAALLLRMGGEKYADYARLLAPVSETHPEAVYMEPGDSPLSERVLNLASHSVGDWVSFLDAYTAMSRLPGGNAVWRPLHDHLRYRHTFPNTDLSRVPQPPTKQWELRELRRFAEGEYHPLPWADELPPIPRHYAHVSVRNPGKVSFTENDAKGVADRQASAMNPGRYLTRFYPDLHPDEVRRLAATLDASFTKLHFATTEDEIEHVYVNGPPSCMSHGAEHYASPIHPVRVYAAGDLAVAYTKRTNGAISGRCLVWPEKKLRGRIYGDIDRMKLLLKAAGYDPEEDDLDGARLLKVPVGRGYVMPYIDNSNSFGFHEDGKHLQIYGDHDATSTDGLSHRGTYCPRLDAYVDDDEDDFTYVYGVEEYWSPTAIAECAQRCGYSGGYYPIENTFYVVFVPSSRGPYGRATEAWHEDYIDNAWLCAATNVHFSDRIGGEEVEGLGMVDPQWAAKNCATCAISGYLYQTSDLVEHNDELVHPDHIPAEAKLEVA